MLLNVPARGHACALRRCRRTATLSDWVRAAAHARACGERACWVGQQAPHRHGKCSCGGLA
jgi:hypothetical protein